ncbi:hypothetical protein DW722_07620 [Mediterraneibacter gnavus]|uniref:hypothetical protein n=1 Tax=Mediterraneibacter gnavus TaxID=33038 RepID=UPI000E49F8D4|nr:hypothetical protein [Mediterraneibacter gnavus]RHE72500.1 hypothetical protein DW722_07620 [Mediterraneibacter gnavus]
MVNHLKICPTCKKEKIQDGIYRNGYVYFYEDTATECPYGHPIIMTSMPDDDFIILSKISDSTDFYDAMIKLHDDDIIEYELKMSQFRSQVEAQEAEAERKKAEESKPRCPKCGSTSITAGQKGYSILTGFLGSNKTVNRCSNCGHTWKP